MDGYVALLATTLVVGEKEVTGRKADAILAAKVASDAVIRLLQPGKKNSELTPLIEKVVYWHTRECSQCAYEA